MLTQLLTLGSRWTLVGGKGGVGKTTTAGALGVALADAGERVLVLSVDPAHSLGDALGVALGPDPVEVPGAPGLAALEVDAEVERRRFVGSRRGRILELIQRGTYLERDDVEELVDLAVPGMDELAALLRLSELAGDAGRRLVIDTAPTGHTLRLLELPRLARGWLGALEAMQEKHQAVATALAGAYRPDQAARMLRELDADLARLEELLTDPSRTRFVLVTQPEPVVLAETRRYQDALARRAIGLAGIVVNRGGPGVSVDAVGPGMVFVPELDPEPTGLEGLRRYAASAAPAPASPLATAAPAPPTLRVGEPYRPPLDRRLYLVGGKGGVGKTTAAAALAVALAEQRAGRVLLLSTDPAGSLGDVLRVPVGPEPAPVPGVERLRARQLDAAAAWDEFRARYRQETERMFAGLLAGGLSAGADQRVVERLIDLAPPGLDELMALLEVVDLTEDRPYDALVLDTAPTGHFLRLLEMPGLALEWTRQLMRLLLRYREVIGLGELGERVLQLSRSLRSLRAQLTSPEHTWLLLVALPEALSVPETRRMIPRLRELGIVPGALLVNRLLREGSVRPGAGGIAAELAGLDGGLSVAGAPDRERGPVGVGELRAFLQGWHRISV